jgi:protein FrlC
MLLTPGWGYLDEPREEAMKRSLDSVSRIARRAGELGVTLALEHLSPISSNLLNTASDLRQMLDNVAEPALKAMFDCCQMHIVGETAEDYFRLLGDDLVHIHLVDGTPGGHLSLGEGEIPLKETLRTISCHNYRGFLSLEIADRRYFTDPVAADLVSSQQYQTWIETL